MIRHGDHGHRTFTTLAKCRWPKAAWVAGDGPFALVAYCGTATVTLHETRAGAEASKRSIDWTACGGKCRVTKYGEDHAHQIVDLRRQRGVAVEVSAL